MCYVDNARQKKVGYDRYSLLVDGRGRLLTLVCKSFKIMNFVNENGEQLFLVKIGDAGYMWANEGKRSSLCNLFCCNEALKMKCVLSAQRSYVKPASLHWP